MSELTRFVPGHPYQGYSLNLNTAINSTDRHAIHIFDP
jgi:hypothetical protein